MKKIMTLCLIRKDDKILLGMKKRGFGVGRWNGFGGKVLPDETVEEGVRREMLEEVGVEAVNLRELGVMEFSFIDKDDVLQVHIFRADDYVGEIIESEEMFPDWFDFDKLPFDKMWPSDIYWMSLLLDDKKFKGSVLFGENDVVLEYDINLI